MSKQMAAELGIEMKMDEEAARKLIEDFYVDDGVTGSDEEGARKLIGDLKLNPYSIFETWSGVQRIWTCQHYRHRLAISCDWCFRITEQRSVRLSII